MHDPRDVIRLLEAVPGAYLVMQPDAPKFTIAEANTAHLQATGSSREDIIGKGVFDAFPHNPDDTTGVENIRDSLMKVITRKKPHKMPIQRYDTRTNDGTYIPRYWNPYHAPVLDDNGNVVFIIQSVIDMTEALELEQQKLEAQEKLALQDRMLLGANEEMQAAKLLQAVSNNATLGLFMMNSDQHCVFMNPAAEAITGYTFAEIKAANKPLHDIIHHTRPDGSPYPMQECPIDRALPQQNHTEGEGMFVRRDGSFYPVAFMASPIIENGQPVGTVIELRDTSEEKMAEEQRSHLIALNKAKDEFISLASHQLRTPATGVKQYVGMLLEGFAEDLTPSQRSLLEVAYSSNERQIALINDLLEVARVDAGKVRLHKEPVNLVPLMKDIIQEQKSTFDGRRQTIEFHCPHATVMAVIDSARIRMALENLIDNASKYTPEGKKITITLAIDNRLKQVRVRIMDQGVGIASDDLPKLFHKFTRLDNPLSTTISGNGLGLYWAEKIVRLHGGTIEVQSKVDHGSTFTVQLPVT